MRTKATILSLTLALAASGLYAAPTFRLPLPLETTTPTIAQSGQSGVGASPRAIGIADGTRADPVVDPEPTVSFQRVGAEDTNSVPFQFSYTKTAGSGFHYSLFSFVRNESNTASDVVATAGSIFALPLPTVIGLAGTPTTGGTLTPNTYTYYVTALVNGKEIAGSTHIDVAVTDGAVSLTWFALADATEYRIYRYISSAPALPPSYQTSTTTALMDTGAVGTPGIGPSQTHWALWGRAEKWSQSQRLAGLELDIVNNSGRAASPRSDRVSSTLGLQIVSAGEHDNSIGLDIGGLPASRFATGIAFHAHSFRDAGIDFSDSDATRPAVRLRNNQRIVARDAAGGTDVGLIWLNSSNFIEIGRTMVGAIAAVTLNNGDNHNVPIGSAINYVKLLGLTSASTVTGVASGVTGRSITLYTLAGQLLTIANEHAGSLAANRIVTRTGADIVGVSAALLFYDGGQARWVVLWAS